MTFSQNYPVINIPSLYKYGLTIQNSTISPQTKLSILRGSCRDSEDIIDITLGDFNANANGITTSAPVRIDNTVNGAGGIDQGTVKANTMYAIFIIADSRGYMPISAIAINAFNIYLVGQVVMPSGYDSRRLIGFWGTDSDTFWQTGSYFGMANDLVFTYDAPQATSVTSGTSNVYASVDLSNFVPNIYNNPVSISTVFSSATAGNTLILASGKSTNPNGQVVITNQSSNINITSISSVLNQFVRVSYPPFAIPTIQYKVSGTSTVAIYVSGFSVSV